MTLRKIPFLLALCLVPLGSAIAQNAQRALTNADIVKIVKSGVGEQTIVLMIEKATPNFDTSPDAVIELKKAGVSDAVLNAMVSASSSDASPAVAPEQDCAQSLDAVLASIGPREKLMAVQSLKWSGTQIVDSASGRSSVSMERVTAFPASTYISRQTSAGLSSKIVLTPDFNYLTSGKVTTTVPASTLQELEYALKLDPIYIAQHRDQYSCASQGTEQIENLRASKLRIRGDGVEAVWNADPATGRLLRTATNTASGRSATDLADWRQVDGIYVSFARRTVAGGVTSRLTISQYAVNPVTDPGLFQAPAGQLSAAVTLKVLQEQSVPYVVQTNGGISTACSISGSTNTSMSASTYGNTTYGTATSTPNLQMNCRSSDTTMRWTHVLNAMFVEASDGNAYIIACDRAWAWSKCVPLKAGDTFLARRNDKGFLVQSLNGKSKEQEATYTVLQSKSLH